MGNELKERFFGCHVSSSGGFENAIVNGRTLGVNAIQIHPSPPQRWNSKPYEVGYEDRFMSERENSPVKRVFFHAIYLVNLATPDSRKFALAKNSLVYYLDLAARIGGDGVVVHVGSAKDQPDDKTAFQRAADGINQLLEKSGNGARLILEVAAGSGRVIGSRMEDLRSIYDLVEQKERVGFGLDTQHLWASGYDLQNELDEVVSQIERNFGFEKVWLAHFNDSKTELGSKKDRHENIGDGLIGKDALQKFANHPKLRDIPLVLETPALKELASAKKEVDFVHTLLK